MKIQVQPSKVKGKRSKVKGKTNKDKVKVKGYGQVTTLGSAAAIHTVKHRIPSDLRS
jgi:hypothetical protein